MVSISPPGGSIRVASLLIRFSGLSIDIGLVPLIASFAVSLAFSISVSKLLAATAGGGRKVCMVVAAFFFDSSDHLWSHIF
jgi:hypothetical protein